MGESPITLSVDTAGLAFWLAPAVVLLVNGCRGLFYWKAPLKWRAGLPNGVWIAVAGVISIAVSIGFKLDIGKRFLGADMPFSGIMAYVVSGIVLTVSSQVAYKLLDVPVQKVKAQVAVAAALTAAALPPVVPVVLVAPVVPDVPFVPGLGSASTIEPVLDFVAAPEPEEPYRVVLMREWLAPKGTGPSHVLLSKKDSVLCLVPIEDLAVSGYNRQYGVIDPSTNKEDSRLKVDPSKL